jgi:hypothetical protein
MAAPTLKPEHACERPLPGLDGFRDQFRVHRFRRSVEQHTEIGIHFGRSVEDFRMIHGFPGNTGYIASMDSPATSCPYVGDTASGTVDIPNGIHSDGPQKSSFLQASRRLGRSAP